MILIIAMVAFLLVTVFFIVDVSRDQEMKSDASSFLYPFSSRTIVKHNFTTSPETVWKAITNLSEYNFWFPGILRLLPAISNSQRYVQQYSFDSFHFAPGSEILVRPLSILPALKGRILSIENNKSLKMEMQMSPFHKEMVFFDLQKSPEGTSVTCERLSDGPFSWLSVIGFENNKSKVLSNLAKLLPVEIVDKPVKSKDKEAAVADAPVAGIPQFANKNDSAAYVVNKVLDGDNNILAAITDKVISGKSKALIIKINKGTAERPPMPEGGTAAAPAAAPAATAGPTFANKDEHVAYIVNKVLDGDNAILENLDDKVIRAKSKSMIMKINKGTAERPPMPEGGTAAAPAAAPAEPSKSESDEELIARLIADGVEGKMDEINALDNKVLRGKIKSGIVKAKKNLN